MQKNRIEAFSDGVLAIIITIMVLELKAPLASNFDALLRLWPVFVSYLLSFVYVGIYWGNHHHLFHTVRHVNGGIIWTNMLLLFWLSLIPFATAWMGINRFAPNTVAVYAVLLELCGLAYYFLQQCIIKSNQHAEGAAEALEKSRIKGIFSQMAYVLAIPLAYLHPAISCFLFTAVAAAWIVPDKGIERALKG
jgi:uncharacterized membrane protein